MFHDVRDLDQTKFPGRYNLKSFLDKKQFQHQLTFINKKYKIISSLDVPNINLEEGNVDYAVLTFDDGLVDHFYVYQELKKLKVSGTFLVPSAPIIDKKMIHSHKIQFILSSQDEKILTTEILSNFDDAYELWVKYSHTKWSDNWWSEEMIFITNFLRHHQSENFNNYQYTDYLFQKYVSQDAYSFAEDFYLNLRQLEEMSYNNMVIGGHGNSSENLLLLSDVESDISRSHWFTQHFSDDFVFSYPNGGFNNDIKNIMKKYKCNISYTVTPQTITTLDKVDHLEFPRYDAPQRIPLK
jgi:peptidoglycan/xylan/chitin deacetylase (PgdA/CDA1 family)